MASTSTTADLADWKPKANPWLIAAAVILATFLEMLDTSVANVALPQMAGSMAASLDDATWVLTSYLVANAIVLPMTGWLSTRFSRKRFIILCTFVFTISSAVCGMATSMSMLITARIIQGAAGGALVPTSQAILMESFPPKKRGLAMAVYGIGVVVAPILGPVIGGWLTDNYSWRWIFYINIPFGLLAVLLLHLFVEDPPYLVEAKKHLRGGLDSVGFIAMAAWLASLQIILDRGQADDWFNAGWICWASVLSVVSMLFFLFWEMRSPHPLVDLRVFKNRTFAVGTLLQFIAGIMFYSITSLVPLFLQGLMNYPSLNSGLAMSLRGIGAVGALVIVGKVSDKIDNRWLLVIGWVFIAYSAFGYGNINMAIAPSTLSSPNIYNGIGLALVMVPVLTISLAGLSNEQMGNGSGISNLARNIGGSVGISLTTTLVTRGAQAHQTMLVGHFSPYDPEFQQKYQQVMTMLSQYSDSFTAQHRAIQLFYGTLLQQSTLLAFVDTFRLLAFTSIACIPFVFLLKKAKSSGGMAMH